MAKKRGFNSPFAGLKTQAPEAKPAPTAPKAPPSSPRVDDGLSDAELFQRAVSGTSRAPRAERIEPEKTLEPHAPDDDALALAELQGLVAGEGSFTLDDTGEVVSGRAPGVNTQLLGRLAAGDFAFQRHLDLHGMSQEQARSALQAFCTEARRAGERCVLIVTGRGKGSPDGVSVLQQNLPRWLSRAPLSSHVLAFATAQRKDGGPGAFYVLLRRAGVRPFGVDPKASRRDGDDP